jgi:hypothetical protein
MTGEIYHSHLTDRSIISILPLRVRTVGRHIPPHRDLDVGLTGLQIRARIFPFLTTIHEQTAA